MANIVIPPSAQPFAASFVRERFLSYGATAVSTTKRLGKTVRVTATFDGKPVTCVILEGQFLFSDIKHTAVTRLAGERLFKDWTKP